MVNIRRRPNGEGWSLRVEGEDEVFSHSTGLGALGTCHFSCTFLEVDTLGLTAVTRFQAPSNFPLGLGDAFSTEAAVWRYRFDDSALSVAFGGDHSFDLEALGALWVDGWTLEWRFGGATGPTGAILGGGTFRPEESVRSLLGINANLAEAIRFDAAIDTEGSLSLSLGSSEGDAKALFSNKSILGLFEIDQIGAFGLRFYAGQPALWFQNVEIDAAVWGRDRLEVRDFLYVPPTVYPPYGMAFFDLSGRFTHPWLGEVNLRKARLDPSLAKLMTLGPGGILNLAWNDVGAETDLVELEMDFDIADGMLTGTFQTQPVSLDDVNDLIRAFRGLVDPGTRDYTTLKNALWYLFPEAAHGKLSLPGDNVWGRDFLELHLLIIDDPESNARRFHGRCEFEVFGAHFELSGRLGIDGVYLSGEFELGAHSEFLWFVDDTLGGRFGVPQLEGHVRVTLHNGVPSLKLHGALVFGDDPVGLWSTLTGDDDNRIELADVEIDPANGVFQVDILSDAVRRVFGVDGRMALSLAR